MDNTQNAPMAAIFTNLKKIGEEIEALIIEYQDYYDMASDSFQNSTEGDATQDSIDSLEDISVRLTRVINGITEAL